MQQSQGETVSLNYDGAGNVISTTDAKGQTQQYSYDADDRKTQVQAADGTTYKYTYDNVNRLTGINDGMNTWSFAYDILDRLISQGTPQGSLTFTYDTVSRLTGFSAPNSAYQPVQYAYDNLDRVISIAQNNKSYSYSYDAIGRRAGLTRPNGVTSTYEYDNGNRLLALTHNKGTQVLERHAYTYDANGNITQYVRGKGTSQPVVIKPCGKSGKGQLRQIVGFIADNAETLTRNYQYDALNRLTDVQGFGIVASASNFRNPGNLMAASMLVDMAKKLNNAQAQKALLRNAELMGAALPESVSWAFDENGNIASKTIHTTTQDKLISYTYDEADRMISLTRPVDEDLGHTWPGHFHWRYPTRGGVGRTPQTETVSLNYDANGNLINDSTGRQFTWNALDQLTQLKDARHHRKLCLRPAGPPDELY